MGPDAGRIRIALRLQAVAQRVADMDRTSFADAVCDAVDAAGRLGFEPAPEGEERYLVFIGTDISLPEAPSS